MEQNLNAYMVKSPYVGEPNYTLQEAMEIMKDEDFRHLPIVEDEKLVGIVSERDLKEALAFPKGSVLKVQDIMKTDVFAAFQDEPLKDVVSKMADLKCGSTVVLNNKNQVVGIFTTTDALRTLADFLERFDEEEPYVLDYLESWNEDTLL